MAEWVAKEGMRVHVLSPDRQQDWGLGTITEVGRFHLPEMEIEIENYPLAIELDDGSITEGMECWWIPVEEMKKILAHFKKQK